MKTVTKSKRKYKFNSQKFFKRLAFSITILLLIVVILSATGSLLSSANKVQRFDDYNVREGDTLWSIAQSYDDYDDIRYFIYQIKTANQLASDYIVPGQQLIIPIGE